MKEIVYVEDALEQLVDLFLWNETTVSWQDQTILSSLQSSLKRNNSLTKKQSYLLLKIITRCQPLVGNELDLTSVVANPQWKNDFRKLDLSKKISVEQDQDGDAWIVMKFPYDLLSDFEELIVTEHNRSSMVWDSERRVKKLKLYDFNVIVIDEYVRKHNFEIDQSFDELRSQVESIWQTYEEIVPYSEVDNNSIVLKNASQETISYFKTNQTNNLNQDMFLAKSMGYPVKLNRTPSSILEKIVSEQENEFWVKSNEQFFDLYKSVDGIAVIIIDRATTNILTWLKNFIVDSEINGIPKDDIRICFREKKDGNLQLNTWIKENNLGGPIKNGKLFIFKHSPAKWIFSKDTDVKIVATNNIIPSNEIYTKYWLNSHHCVLCISDIKPTNTRNKKIVKV